MDTAPQCAVRSIVRSTRSLYLLYLALALPCVALAYGRTDEKPTPITVQVNLSEWKVQLTPTKVPPGPVVFKVTNAGTIAHAFELEGRGLEKSTPRIQPGATVTLRQDLRAGSYEAYCPVGKGSHKMLGMMSHLTVGDAKPASGQRASR